MNINSKLHLPGKKKIGYLFDQFFGSLMTEVEHSAKTYIKRSSGGKISKPTLS